MNRMDNVKDFLDTNAGGGPWSATQIRIALGEPEKNAKFISSTLTRLVASGYVESLFGICPVTGRRVLLFHRKPGVRAGTAGNRGGKGPGTGAAGAGTQGNRGKKGPPPPPPPPPRMSAAERARAEAKRKAAEDAKRRRVVVVAAKSAAETFARLTGYSGNDRAEMKAAFRRAALALHPDRGGDHAEFAALSAAWDTLQKT